MKRVLMYLLTAGVLGACASSGEAPLSPIDPIVVPEAAVPVADMTLLRNEVWTPINRRMLLAQAGTKYFLLTFDNPCPPLGHSSPQVWLSTYGTNAVRANDILRVDNVMCPVNDIYAILEEDWVALKTRAKR
jgi:hypothetical protein